MFCVSIWTEPSCVLDPGRRQRRVGQRELPPLLHHQRLHGRLWQEDWLRERYSTGLKWLDPKVSPTSVLINSYSWLASSNIQSYFLVLQWIFTPTTYNTIFLELNSSLQILSVSGRGWRTTGCRAWTTILSQQRKARCVTTSQERGRTSGESRKLSSEWGALSYHNTEEGEDTYLPIVSLQKYATSMVQFQF